MRDIAYESLRRSFGPPEAVPRLSEKDVKARLTRMLTTYGRDDSTEPGSILDSAVPNGELIGELTKIRTAALNRLSDEGLSDVEITNAMIQALRYRGR